MVSNADVEMRWVQAWSELYEIIGEWPDIVCRLPDGQLVDVEVCKGWLQESVYHGWFVKVEEGQHNGTRIIVALRWR
jgi:hypothetical protein